MQKLYIDHSNQTFYRRFEKDTTLPVYYSTYIYYYYYY